MYLAMVGNHQINLIVLYLIQGLPRTGEITESVVASPAEEPNFDWFYIRTVTTGGYD